MKSISFAILFLAVPLFCKAQLVWPLSRNYNQIENGESIEQYRRINALFGERHSWLHLAIDTWGPNGTNVRSITSGVVINSDPFNSFVSVYNVQENPWTIIRYGDNVGLANGVNPASQINAGVHLGNIIGGNHLHFEVYEFHDGQWIAINPLIRNYRSIDNNGAIDNNNIDLNDQYSPVINSITLTPIGRESGIIIKPRANGGSAHYALEHIYQYEGLEGREDLRNDRTIVVNISNVVTFDYTISKNNSLYLRYNFDEQNPHGDRIIAWGNLGPSLQGRDIGVTDALVGRGQGVYSIRYYFDRDLMYGLKFDKLNNIYRQDSVNKKMINSVYNEKWSNGRNENITNYIAKNAFYKLHHADGEVLTSFQIPIPDEPQNRANGIIATRERDGERRVLDRVPDNLNMKYARSNEESLFKEGSHEMTFEVNDLNIDHLRQSTIDIIIDNFKPYLSDISLIINTTELSNSNIVKSIRREFDPKIGVVNISEDSSCILDPANKKVYVKFKSSEILDENSISAFIYRRDYSGPLNNKIDPLGHSFDKQKLIYQFEFPPLCTSEKDPGYSTDYDISIRAKDYAGNELILFKRDLLYPQADYFQVPVRISENNWNPWMPSGPDSVMTFNFSKIGRKPRLTISGPQGNINYCGEISGEAITLKANASRGEKPYDFNWVEVCDPLDENAKCITVYSSTSLIASVKAGECITKKYLYVGRTKINCAAAHDPNDLLGPAGLDSLRWVARKDTLAYTIRFENYAGFATAPAQRIYLEYPFDDNANPATFRVGRFGFAGKTFEVPPGRIKYQARVDARDSVGVWVDMLAGVDPAGRKAYWIFQAVDPATGLPPEDRQKGLLPVNDSVTNKGRGFVEFTLKARATAATADILGGRASILFDANDTIPTNAWANTLDAAPPASQMLAVAGVEQDTVTIPLAWTAQDDPGGCGIGGYNIYVSEDGAPFVQAVGGWQDTGYLYSAQRGHAYRFFVQAVDRVGNAEPLKNLPEVEARVKSDPHLDILSVNSLGLCSGDSLRLAWSSAEIDSVHIAYSADGGLNFTPVAIGLADAPGYFVFAAGPYAQDQTLLLRITDAAIPPRGQDTVSVVVHPRPSVTVAPHFAAICAGEPLLLAASASAAGISYAWSPYYALDAPDSSVVRITATETTRFDVTIRDANGCLATDSALVVIHPRDSIHLDERVCSPADTGFFLQVYQNRFGCDSILTWYRALDTFPPVVITRDILAPLDSAGQVSITPEEVNGGTFDNCQFTLRLSRSAFTCADAGVNTVWLIATDALGRADSAAALVTVGTDRDLLAQVALQVFLQGPYVASAQRMHDSLRVKGLIPLSEPYTGMANFTHYGGGGGETITPAVLAVTGENAIVDWVFLELRSAADSSQVLATRAALLQRDGDVVDTDGVSAVAFGIPAEQSYYIVARHRNHLSAQLGAPVWHPECNRVTRDFRVTPPEGFFAFDGLNPVQKTISGKFALWAGNGRSDYQLKYNGSNNDRTAILSVVGLATPNAIIPGYLPADYNLDGVVKYNGAANDRNVLLGNVGIVTPSAIIYDQIAR